MPLACDGIAETGSTEDMDDCLALVQKIHDSPQQGVLAVSGAGTNAIAWIMGVAGASRTVLEVVIPYASNSMIYWVGREPDQYVSVENGRDMAKAAYRRALHLREGMEPVLGLGCTATIATDRPKRGDHRAVVAAQDAVTTTTWSLTFHKGLRDRAGEEDVVSRLILLALAEFSGLNPELELGLTTGDSLEAERTARPEPLDELLAGEVRWLVRHPDGSMDAEGNAPPVLLPGSFNPLHTGHREMMEAAGQATGQPRAFELSVTNVDKPPLEKAEILRRLAHFGPVDTVVLTRAETFQKKAALFPRNVFLLGWDTAIRLVAPRYYGGEAEMMLALSEIMAGGTKFLVAGRSDSGVFRTLSDVNIPAGFAQMFTEIAEAEFRCDISSTELRQAGSGG